MEEDELLTEAVGVLVVVGVWCFVEDKEALCVLLFVSDLVSLKVGVGARDFVPLMDVVVVLEVGMAVT